MREKIRERGGGVVVAKFQRAESGWTREKLEMEDQVKVLSSR